MRERALLERRYKDAYELCDQVVDRRGLIYSALAQLRDGWDPEEPERRVREYLEQNFSLSASGGGSVEPELDVVVLYAMYLLHTLKRPAQPNRELATLYLQAFELFEADAARWLSPRDTIEALLAAGDDAGAADAAEDPSGPRARWERAKLQKGARSDAMDELMAMVGLKSIKEAAFALWTDVQLASLRPAKVNADVTHHFLFQGSPGTGKTVVAKLMAKILKQLGVRDKSTFESRTGGELLRDGADEFKKLLTQVDGGVLFLDEVYREFGIAAAHRLPHRLSQTHPRPYVLIYSTLRRAQPQERSDRARHPQPPADLRRG